MAAIAQQPIDANYFYERSVGCLRPEINKPEELLSNVKEFVNRGGLLNSERGRDLLKAAAKLNFAETVKYIHTTILSEQAALTALSQTQLIPKARAQVPYPGEPAIFQLRRHIEQNSYTRIGFSSDTKNAFINEIHLEFHRDGKRSISIRSEYVDEMKAFLAAEGFPINRANYQFTQSTYEKQPSLEEMEPILKCWRIGDTQGMRAALAARPDLGIRMDQYPFIYPQVAYCDYYVTDTEDAKRILEIVTKNNTFPQNAPMSSHMRAPLPLQRLQTSP